MCIDSRFKANCSDIFPLVNFVAINNMHTAEKNVHRLLYIYTSPKSLFYVIALKL